MSHLVAGLQAPTNSQRTRGTSATEPVRTRRAGRGFTLVEMLVAMVLTLIMVGAIAEFYAYVGETVRDGRAMIEMGSQLRAAVQRLKADFDQITCSIAPAADDGGAHGYFEYFEGQGNDFDTNGNFVRDDTNDEDTYPIGSPNNIGDLVDLGVTNLLGDGDDYLAFTIRSGGAPFSGRYTVGVSSTMVYSQLAEVAWWVGYDDLPSGPTNQPNAKWDFNEPRHIYRRQLLIRPQDKLDVNLTTGQPNTYTDLNQVEQRLYRIQQESDISLSIAHEVSGNTVRYYIRSNSLQDLAKRENRFAHQWAQITNTSPISDQEFPHSLLLVPPIRSGNTIGVSPITSWVLQAYYGTPNETPGEDIVLSNILAFDIQIYDPNVRLLRNDSNSPQTVLLPSDPGYALALSTANANDVVGLGGYVDLGYNRYNRVPGAGAPVVEPNAITTAYPAPQFSPHFSDAPAPPPVISGNSSLVQSYFFKLGCTYDTWTASYERDGVFQLLAYGVNATRMDMQTNGVDDDGTNGVDDYGERETIAPYPPRWGQPPRGLQVKIRMYEPSTRQMRQATVTTDFLAE